MPRRKVHPTCCLAKTHTPGAPMRFLLKKVHLHLASLQKHNLRREPAIIKAFAYANVVVTTNCAAMVTTPNPYIPIARLSHVSCGPHDSSMAYFPHDTYFFDPPTRRVKT